LSILNLNFFSGVTCVILDGSIDAISFDGNVSYSSFLQHGNRLLVYRGNDPVFYPLLFIYGCGI